ncbi:MAG: alpha/beta hydrolase, partial [Treponemataceae bacterium]
PDLRGHGRSEGNYIGFGLPDSEDILKWVDRLICLRGGDVKIVLFGVSMGGATVLTAAGSKPQANVVCAISDCGYSNTRDILGYKIKKLYGLPPFPIVNAVVSITRLIAGYNINEASPRDAVKRSLIPLLFIHGDADAFVPVAMAHELFKAATCEKQILIVPGAGHAESCTVGGTTYEDLVETFIRSALDYART